MMKVKLMKQTPKKNKAFIFFCGSSSVGKTTLVEQFPARIVKRLPIPVILSDYTVDTVKPNPKIDIIRTEMSFRNIRARIGNPSWEELQTDHAKGIYQQEYGMDLYNERIYEKLENDEEGIFLFERCPYDIVGYSTAFGLPQKHGNRLELIADLIFKTISTNHKVVIAYRRVDWSYPYDRQNGIRPDESIRRLCDMYCDTKMQRLINSNSSELLIPYISVNQDRQEIEHILSMVM